jgi:hypothetical protein
LPSRPDARGILEKNRKLIVAEVVRGKKQKEDPTVGVSLQSKTGPIRRSTPTM